MFKNMVMYIMRNTFKLLEWFVFTFWGLTVIDLLPLEVLQEFNMLDHLDQVVRVVLGLIGVVFLIITLPIRIKNQKLSKEIKEEELEALKWQNEKHEAENYKKINKIK